MIPCLSCTGTRGGASGNSAVYTTISECRQYEGTDYLKLGRLATGAIKGAVRIAGKGDSDIHQAVGLIKDIHGLAVFSYDDCSEDDKASISDKLANALAESELLMEASDSGTKVKFYGTYDEISGLVRDFVLFVPSESALICIKGSVSMDTIARIAADD